jgi:hypothetical protein
VLEEDGLDSYIGRGRHEGTRHSLTGFQYRRREGQQAQCIDKEVKMRNK